MTRQDSKFGKHWHIGDAKTLFLLCFVGVVLAVCLAKYADYDLWWHLRLGKTIVDEGAIYSVDEYSHTYAGTQQWRGEWLADLVLYLTFRLGGMTGLIALKTLLILTTMLFLYRACRENVREIWDGNYAILITLVVVLFAMRFRLFVRPYLFSYLGMALFLASLEKYDRTRQWHALWLLPLVEIAWANMSIGMVFGPLIGGFYLAGRVLLRRNWREIRRFSSLLVLIVFASCVSPEGIRPYLYLASFSTGIGADTIGEFQSLSVSTLWGYGFRYTFGYQMLVIGSAATLILAGARQNLYHVLLGGVFFVESVLHVRMIDFFALTSAVLFLPSAARLTVLLGGGGPGRRRLRNAVLVGGMAALIPLTVLASETYSFGIGVKEGVFPEKALAYLDARDVNGTLFNSYAFGGYIIWKSPARKVFIDGRHRHLYPGEFVRFYRKMIQEDESWKQGEAEFGIDYALVEYDWKSRQFPVHLSGNPDWVPVFWDDVSVVYLGRTPQNASLIERDGYKVARPTLGDLSYIETLLHGGASTDDLLAGLALDIERNPMVQEPRLARVLVLSRGGQAQRVAAEQELRTTLTLPPDLAMEHSALAYFLYLRGDVEGFREQFAAAEALDPTDPMLAELRHFVERK